MYKFLKEPKIKDSNFILILKKVFKKILQEHSLEEGMNARSIKYKIKYTTKGCIQEYYFFNGTITHSSRFNQEGIIYKLL